jgi:hypothetical protein
MNPMSYMNDLKNLPDQQLQKYLQMPNSPIPQFMVAAELQRRNEMRQSQKAQQPMQPSIREQLAPQQPEGYAKGGLVAFADGGLIPEYDENGNIIGYSSESGGGGYDQPMSLKDKLDLMSQGASSDTGAVVQNLRDKLRMQSMVPNKVPPAPQSIDLTSPSSPFNRAILPPAPPPAAGTSMLQYPRGAMGNRPPLPTDSGMNAMPSAPLPIMRASSVESSRTPGQPPVIPSAPIAPPANFPVRRQTDLPPELTQSPDDLKALVDQNAAERNKGYEELTAGRRQTLTDREGKLDESKKQGALLALLQAGLGIMGGSSPYALQNIGTGGQRGLDALNKVLEEDKRSRADIEDKKFALNLAQYEAKLRNEGLAKSDIKDRVEQAQRLYAQQKEQASEAYSDKLKQLDFGLKTREVAAKESDSIARNKSADANMMDALSNQQRTSLMLSAGTKTSYDPAVMEFAKEWSRVAPSVKDEAYRIAAKDPRVTAEDKFLRGGKDRQEYRAMLDKVAREYINTQRETAKTDYIQSISDLRGGMAPGIQTAESLLKPR